MVMKLDLKKEDKLLLFCAQTTIKPAIVEKIRSIIQDGVNWDYIIRMGHRHNLIPLLYWQLNEICPDSVPENVMVEFKYHFDRNAEKNRFMFGELLRILKIFDSHSIPTIPYKGPILAIEEYGNLSLREFNDLDIYVPFSHVYRAKEILLNQGYFLDIQLETGKENKFIKTQRDIKFFSNTLGIVLELHWTFKSFYFSLPSGEHLCEKNDVVKLSDTNVEAYSPSPEDLFLILCLHNASHRWAALFWLCDINQMIKSHNLDWDKIMEKARKQVIERIVLINIYLVNDLWGVEIPEEVRSDFDSQIIEEVKKTIFTNEKSSSLFQELLITIKLRDNLIYGIKDVLRSIFTPGVCEWKTLSLPIQLWPLYRIYRPFNLIRRYKNNK